jgi:cytochrome c oxidase subunit 2
MNRLIRWTTSLLARPAAAPALLALGGALLLGGCGAHPRDTLDPAGDSAEVSAWFFWLYMILDTVIFALVAAAFFYALRRFRKRPGDDDTPNMHLHGNTKLEIIWTVIPTLIILVLSTITVAGVFQLDGPPKREQRVIEVDVIGKQWWWEYDYKGYGFSTANELHVEEDTEVLLNLTSADVMHAFWVPRVSGKRDATPGRTYPLRFRPFTTGGEVKEFVGQCAELCGASHARMGLKLFVHPKEGPSSFEAWVAGQQAAAREPQTDEEKRGKQLYETKGCVGCHSVRGVRELAQRSRTSGPDLTHVGSRTSIAANTLPNDVGNLTRWIQNPQAVKEAALMTNLNLSRGDARAIATYLWSLK